MNDNKLGIYLKEQREKLKYSLREAADVVGLSHSYLSTIEKGEDPRSHSAVIPKPEILKKISDGYGVTYSYLLKLAGYESTTAKELSDILNKNVSVGIEDLMKDTLEFMENQDTLMLSGEIIDHDDFDRVKSALLFSLDVIRNDIQRKHRK